MSSNFHLTKENLPLIEQMAEQMPGGFFIYKENENRELLYINQNVLDIFGCETLEEFKELTGYTFPGMVHPEDFEMIQLSIDGQISPEDGEDLDYVEYRIIRKDGIVRWVDDYGHFSHTEDFGDIFYVFIGDITDKYVSIQERERRANESKNAFLFNISHDIRTPLNAVLGYTRLAQLHYDEPEKVSDYLEKVETSGNELLNLIDDLIDMSQMDFGHMQLNATDCNLKAELQKLHAVYENKAKEKNIKLRFSVDVPNITLHLDTARFKKLIGNLIDNALQFTPEHGEIKVLAKCNNKLSRSSAEYEFTVIDSGIGMSEEFISHIYEPFEKERSSTETGVSGIGIGLTITKHLVSVMGGSISVDSHPDKGTKFTVILPIQVSNEEEFNDEGNLILTQNQKVAQLLQDDDRSIPKISVPHRVLLAEDIQMNRALAETILEEAGYVVESVFNGADALEKVESNPPRYYDIILMDVQMPVMDGHDATHAIRELDRPDTKVLPIIALSANTREEDQRRSLSAGMNAHIGKPFDPAELIALMESFIEEAEKKYE
ncbi:MAG: response regulator [Lachnospiraceae bacterium]|nr:response regulator [Lachnospiraceae bacterium]